MPCICVFVYLPKYTEMCFLCVIAISKCVLVYWCISVLVYYNECVTHHVYSKCIVYWSVFVYLRNTLNLAPEASYPKCICKYTNTREYIMYLCICGIQQRPSRNHTCIVLRSNTNSKNMYWKNCICSVFTSVSARAESEETRAESEAFPRESRTDDGFGPSRLSLPARGQQPFTIFSAP